MKLSGRHLLVVVAMCGLLASGVGLVTNVAGLFFTPVSEEFGALRGQVSLMLTITNISFAFGGMIAPRLLTEKTLKPLLIGATAVNAAATVGFSFCQGVMPMYALCVVRGLAAGMIGFVFVTSVINRWFVTNVALASSIAMACSGLAGALFSPIINGIIGGVGWRMGYVAIAAFTVLLNLPAILLLPSLDPATAGLEALGAGTVASESKAKAETGSAVSAAPVSMVILGAVIGYAVLATAVTAIPQFFPGMAESYGFGAALGASMLSASMVANSLGKIVLGALIDRLGTRISTLIYAAVVAASLVMLLIIRSPQMLIVAAALCGLCYSLGTVAITMITRDAFGVANYDKTYPTISLAGNFANAIFSSVVGFMYDFSGGYVLPIIVLLACLGTAVAAMLYVYSHRAEAVA
jgi:MFS family permease